MSAVVIGGMIGLIFGIFVITPQCDKIKERQKERQTHCEFICEPHPVKWAKDGECLCDTGSEVRKWK